MQQMGLNEIRERFLSFFASKGHLRAPSAPLVPQGDASLLLINSGMAPLKSYFSGEVTPPAKRMTTCQKCIRTPDIENVGKTSRHGTFFEMLGHFSFGDYFKREAIAWTWEFLTEEMGMDKHLLYATVYLDDDEAEALWLSETDIEPSHVSRLGKEDNFWEIGSGPCGPSSEIFYDRGLDVGCGKPDCAPGCDCDRFVEIGNNVFTQFSNDGNGNYTPLKQKNIDYGGGLERLACFMQNVSNLFEVDTIRNVLNHAAHIAGVEYKQNEKTDVSLRIITDHIRSTTMLIGDGVLPSNEGRGYILRRLLRRAARHGKLLGIDRAFLVELSETVIQENGGAYPEIVQNSDYIKKVIAMEEERFNATIDSGLRMLNERISTLKAGDVFDGADAFKLYDTYGFPIDLTLEILDENKLSLDRETFDRLMNEQRTRARAAREKLGDHAWESEDFGLERDVKTEFIGYNMTECDAQILAVISDSGDTSEGNTVSLILDRTPFYAESGGQVADSGVISTDNGDVSICYGVRKLKDGKYVHSGIVVSGGISNGPATATVNRVRRQSIMRAHSTTHLLQKALRDRLGSHITQAGSFVEPDRLRFDFSHFSAVTAEELHDIECKVNHQILNALDVTVHEMPIDEARKLGAVALFGEKYGDIVRVVTMGDYSVELCGGTHLDNTSKAGLFKITGESSVAAGVRRIEAVVGMAALSEFCRTVETLHNAADALRTSPADLTERITAQSDELRAIRRELDTIKSKAAQGGIDAHLDNATDIGGIKVLTLKFDGTDTPALRAAGDRLRDKEPSVAAVLASQNEGKITLLAVCGDAAIQRGVNAGDLLKAICEVGGGSGGGKPQSAMGGIKDAERLDTALAAAEVFVRGIVN